jgi:hypothetical protein
VVVWVEATGQQTGPPLQPSQVRSQAQLAAIIVPFVLAFILLWTGQLAKNVLDRRRLARWDTDWRATGPPWTRQQ